MEAAKISPLHMVKSIYKHIYTHVALICSSAHFYVSVRPDWQAEAQLSLLVHLFVSYITLHYITLSV